MALESDDLADPLVFADPLLSQVAAAEEPRARASAGMLHDKRHIEALDDGSLLELFSLIADAEVDDGGDSELASDDTPSVANGGKRLLSTTPSASDSPATEPPAATRKKKKRRYQEVLRMRETAAELEQKLNTLKARQGRVELAWVQREEDGASGVRKWQKEAKNEIQAAVRARMENAKLRKKVKVQADFAKCLQEPLAKRQCSIEELQQIVVRSDRDEVTFARPRTPKESAIYGLLIKNIYTRACELDDFFRINALAEIKSTTFAAQQEATFNEARILLNEDEALCVDLIDGYIIPFDFNAGAHVLWAHVLSKQLKLAGDHTRTEIIVTTDDVIVTKQSANANFLIQGHEHTTEYSISKRVCGTNCVSFLWESITESNGALGSSQGTPAIRIIQKGWVKVKHVNTTSGSSAASLQAYIRLTPSTIRADLDEKDASEEGVERLQISQQFDAKALTAYIVSSYRQHAESIRRFLENTLIDDMIQATRPSQRC